MFSPPAVPFSVGVWITEFRTGSGDTWKWLWYRLKVCASQNSLVEVPLTPGVAAFRDGVLKEVMKVK